MSDAVPFSTVATDNKRRVGFYLAGALFLLAVVAVYGFIIQILHYPLAGWFAADFLGAHQLHDTVGPLLLWAAILGVVVQAIRPEQQVGAMQQTVLITTLFVVLAVLTGFFVPPMVLFLLPLAMAALHPARGQLLRVHGANPRLLGLLLLAVVPLLDFAIAHISLQQLDLTGDTHAEKGHWLMMAAYTLSILSVGLLPAFRPRGWRVPAWSTGVLAVFFGLASTVLPPQASHVGPEWGALAIIWGIVYVGVAEWTTNGRGEEEGSPSAQAEARLPGMFTNQSTSTGGLL